MHESKYPQFQISTTIRKHSLYKFHISTVIYTVVHPSIVKITIYIYTRTIRLSRTRVFAQIKYNPARKGKRGNERKWRRYYGIPALRNPRLENKKGRGKLKRKKKTSRSRPPSAF